MKLKNLKIYDHDYFLWTFKVKIWMKLHALIINNYVNYFAIIQKHYSLGLDFYVYYLNSKNEV